MSFYGRGRSNPLRNEVKPKRQVYPTSEIAHLWAHQTQPNARNPQGNFYFRGRTIYSYRDSYPIAQIVPVGEKSCVLFRSGPAYSPTTGQHFYAVERAVPSSIPLFKVPFFSGESMSKRDHMENVKFFLASAQEEMDKVKRSRGRGEWNLGRAFDFRDKCRQYCKLFKLKMPVFGLPSGKALSNLKAELDRKTELLKASTAKAWETKRLNREKRWAERNAQWEEQRRQEQVLQSSSSIADRMEKWSAGSSVSTRYFDTVLLRISGPEVETSLGARVPLDHARRALKLVRATMASGRPFESNGHSFHVGYYTVDRVEPDGTLKAGCHTIPWSSIARIQDDLDGRVDQGEVILSDAGQPRNLGTSPDSLGTLGTPTLA